jgi:hypothetical protein
MDRVNADDYYYFDRKYFKGLMEAEDLSMHLFSALYEGEVICSTIFSLCSEIVQSYLGGTKSAFLRCSPDRLVSDEARLWANGTGARFFHLGGGLGAREDSLFNFKAGFSHNRHDFYVWRLVVDKRAYGTLSNAKEQWNKEHGQKPISKGFFPYYRCNTVPTK